LYGFQHRLIIKLCCFSYKILNNPESPLPLKTQLITKKNCVHHVRMKDLSALDTMQKKRSKIYKFYILFFYILIFLY
ncbi:hypothetical protein BpHYR1_038489, partial [Brachionus plicatilis]